MLSLIICSRTPQIAAGLEQNITATIGVEYEIVLIDNSQNKYDIFEAYNLGVKQSKYPYLCFMHDDIVYHTQNWGKLAVLHFAGEKTGAIGIAGTPYVPYLPGAWWGGQVVNINVLPADTEKTQASFNKYPPTTANKNKVVVLDGVWLCIRRSLFDTIRFDNASYTGFHFYDADITMQVYHAGYDVYCVFDINIQHFSKGDVNGNWLENALIFNKKWERKLPVACTPIPYAEKCEAELKTLNELTAVMITNHEPRKWVYRFALKRLLKYVKLYFYYKTPVHLTRYLEKSL